MLLNRYKMHYTQVYSLMHVQNSKNLIAPLTVERPLLRYQFRAGYLVEGMGWRGSTRGSSRGETRAAAPRRVARQQQLGHSGSAHTTHQLCTRSLPDTRFSIISIFNWASRSLKICLQRCFTRTLFVLRDDLCSSTVILNVNIIRDVCVFFSYQKIPSLSN